MVGHFGDGDRPPEQSRDVRLTTREVEVSQLLLAGFAGKGIAEKRHVSIETVRAHKKQIYGKGALGGVSPGPGGHPDRLVALRFFEGAEFAQIGLGHGSALERFKVDGAIPIAFDGLP